MNIAHLELGRHHYGGAVQVRYLLGALSDNEHRHTLITSEGSSLHDWARSAGQAHVALAFRGEHDLGFVWRLRRWLRDNDIDLLHVHSRRGADWMGAIAASLAGASCILTRRVDHQPRRWLRWLMNRRYRRVIGISDSITAVLRESGVADENLLTIRSAVDAQPIDPAARKDVRELLPDCPADAPVLAVIAQLIERKGHRYLVSVLGGLRERFPDLRVVFFGRGPLKAALEADVAAKGLEDCVWFAGFRDDVVALLPSVTLVVHPALREGLGVSLLQAAAAEVPVVGFRAGGVPEAVVHEHTGLLVRAGDSVALAAAIGRLLSDPAYAATLGGNARRRILGDFSIHHMVRRYAALYDVLAGEQQQ